MKRAKKTLIVMWWLLLSAGTNVYGQFSAFAHVTYETQKEHGLEVWVLPVQGQEDKCKVIVPCSSPDSGHKACYLVVRSEPVPSKEQNLRRLIWKRSANRGNVLTMNRLPALGGGTLPGSFYVETILDKASMTRSYIYIDFPTPIYDGGFYYSVDLSTYPMPEMRKADIRYSPAAGLGPESGVMRRDPSDVIRVHALSQEGHYFTATDTYYVWYTKSNVAHGYDATVWYATSPDGYTWTEQGEALARGAVGSWDEQSVFTPNILKARDKYYLFYTGVPKPFKNEGNRVTKSAIGIAVADSPDGPWTKLDTNPVLTCSDDEGEFDSMRVDDACLLVRGGKYWLYYKGRRWDDTPAHTMMGVAIAEEPEGPYVKYDGNPIVKGGHEVLVWPVGAGVVAMVNIGPEGIRRTLQYAPDGLTFSKLQGLDTVPSAPGAYRPQAFRDKGNGEMIEWGLHIGTQPGSLPFLERFDCQW